MADRQKDDRYGIPPHPGLSPNQVLDLKTLCDRFGPDASAMEWDIRPKLCWKTRLPTIG